MDADPLSRPSRRAARGLAPALVLALVLAPHAGAASAAAAGGAPAPVEKPSAGAAASTASKRPGEGPGWYDGRTWRPLAVEPALRAESGAAVGKTLVLRRVAGPVKDADPAAVVLRDDSGRVRALPGGVLVVLRAPLPEAEARALIGRAGATPARALSPSMWVVEGPVGLGSLELANRLHASGAFAAAQPNWWVERTLK